MKNIAIFYASTHGNTKKVADKISKGFDNLKEYNIQITKTDYMKDYKNIILGISTWEKGEMQKDWLDIWEDFCEIDFTNKTVAIFGLGDQVNYKNNFVDALGTLYTQLKESNANVVGFTSTDGYNFESSDAVVDDNFVGLVIDPDNQDFLTENRVKNWVELLKKEFK